MLKAKGIERLRRNRWPAAPGQRRVHADARRRSHRDYVTHAWTDKPLREVLAKIPALTQIAVGDVCSGIR